MIDKIKKIFGFLIIAIFVVGIVFFFVLLATNNIKFSGKKEYEEKVVAPKEAPTVKIETKKTEEELKKEAEEKAAKEYKIDTVDGHIKGEERSYKYTTNNETYYAFQGIPYAKPPVGNLRFKNPEPVTPWEDELDTTKEKNICPQKSIPGQEPSDVIGSEDCLYLNVYTPHRPDKIQTLLPVMIWFHGGGFQRGSGNTDYYGPDFLIKNDVILVTFNYRLGALGFLNLQITDAPGNLGIKDQVMVLKWVKSNISKFGGDSGNITLFGEDSGAVSIQILTLSRPLRKEDLFHRVILQSGSVVNPWAFNLNNEEDAHKLAKKLDINTLSLDYDKIVEELRGKPVLDIINAQDSIIEPQDMEMLKLFAFVPSMETPLNGTEYSLITSNPYLSFASGHLDDIPTIAGITNSEANIAFLYYPELITSQLMESLNQVPDTFLPSILKDFENKTMINNAKSIVKKFFFKDKHITWEKIPEFLKLLSDGLVSIGMYMTIELMKSTPSPLYVYEFSYEGDLNYAGNKVKEIFGMKNENERVKALAASTTDGKNNINSPSNGTNNKVDYSKTKTKPIDKFRDAVGAVMLLNRFNKLQQKNYDKNLVSVQSPGSLSGASHEDELGYLFLVNKHDKEVPKDKHEYQVREQLSLMWTNFAKTTNPNSDKVIVKWLNCTETNPSYLVIGDKFESKSGNIEEIRYLFWYNLFISVFQGDTTVIQNYVQNHELL